MPSIIGRYVNRLLLGRFALVLLGLAALTLLLEFLGDSDQVIAANDDPITVLNPLASHLSVMRSTLLGGLVSALSYNLNRKASRVRVFEIGRVYRRAPEIEDGPLEVAGIDQPMRVGGLVYGPNDDEQWGIPTRDADFFDVKGDIERLLPSARFVAAKHPSLHPGRGATVELGERSVGYLGQLHPRLQQKYELPRAPLVFEVELAPLLQRSLPRYAEVPRFQPLERDISVAVNESVPAQAIVDAVHARSRTDDRLSALRAFRLFDLYRAPLNSSKVAEASANALLNKDKSLAFRVVLQHTGRPLSDTDVDTAVEVILEVLERDFGARPRR